MTIQLVKSSGMNLPIGFTACLCSARFLISCLDFSKIAWFGWLFNGNIPPQQHNFLLQMFLLLEALNGPWPIQPLERSPQCDVQMQQLEYGLSSLLLSMFLIPIQITIATCLPTCMVILFLWKFWNFFENFFRFKFWWLWFCSIVVTTTAQRKFVFGNNLWLG